MCASWNVGIRGMQVLPLVNEDAETIRVEAGPGTGKTFGLVRRVERILHPNGLRVAGGDTLVVAFNRVIAKQLQEDINARLATFQHDGDPVIRTIHALCVQVIGADLRLLLPHEFEMMIYDVLWEFPAFRQQYGSFDATAQAFREHEAHNADHLALWQAARRWLERHNACLVSDLPGLLLDRLHAGDFPAHRYTHVIVDEFQDLTNAEQQLMFRLRRQAGQLVALGDPRQSIYAFRGNDREGLANLEALAAANGNGAITNVLMNECQRCPGPIVHAANRLMMLNDALAMVPVSPIAANLHVVVWHDPHTEAGGMAQQILQNIRAHPNERHLVMVTRRQFGYWLRDQIAHLDQNLRVALSFSEGLLETWAVREAFLLFCLLNDPDRPTWRAWLGYKNSTHGIGYKATQRNAGAYLRLLAPTGDQITAEIIEQLAAEPRNRQRGAGGTIIWDRARRFLDLRENLNRNEENGLAYLASIFDPARWIGAEYVDTETARLDMQLLRDKATALFDEQQDAHPAATIQESLREVARRLRQQIATREPFAAEVQPDLQVATLWGAKGITADHVYMLGVCEEALPGDRRDEYPGTDAEYRDEQRRLFYVSITRSRQTLVISRARTIDWGEAQRLGLALRTGHGTNLAMSPFFRDIMPLLPAAVEGHDWPGCV